MLTSRFLHTFSRLFSDFQNWTFLKCPKSISLFTFGKKWLTEKYPIKYGQKNGMNYRNDTKIIINSIIYTYLSTF